MRRAFTLIEILCTVVILSIAAAVVVPQMGITSDLALSAASRQILSDLDMARSEAITRNTTVYISFTPATGFVGGSFSVARASAGSLATMTNPFTKSTWTSTFGTGTFKAVKLTSAAFSKSGTTGLTVLAFDSTGFPYATSSTSIAGADLLTGVITLSSGSKTMTVRIEPGTGALSVQ